MSEPTSPSPRIGDAERDDAVQCLQAHMGEGRLTSAEFDERMSSALQARTLADLNPLFEDLPEPLPERVVSNGPSLTPSTLGSVSPYASSQGAVAKSSGNWDLSPQAIMATIMGVSWGLAIILFFATGIGFWVFLIPALLLPALGNLIRSQNKNKEIGLGDKKPKS